MWVQGEKVDGQWFFDDGTPIPEYCQIDNGGAEDKHHRAKGSTYFFCPDAPNNDLYPYSCEYYP